MRNQENCIILSYSNTGNNAFIAKKLADKLCCETEEIIPKAQSTLWLILKSLLKLPAKLKPLQHDISQYENVILMGPIWMGTLVAPIRGYVKQYIDQTKKLSFITTCGGNDDQKNDKFGYENVFKTLREIVGNKLRITEAIPVTLSVPNFDPKGQNILDIRINDQNFPGEMEDRLNNIVHRFQEKEVQLELI